MYFSKRKTLNHSFARKEYQQSAFIPYEGHWNENTVITKNGELMMVMKLEGFSFETADDDDVDMRKNIRNTLFKSIASGEYALWFHTIRKRRKVDIEGEYDNEFCNYVNNKWDEKHDDTESFINELYITVIAKRDTQGMAKISDIFKSLSKKIDKDGLAFELKTKHRDLEDLVNRMAGSLKEYRPKILGLRKEDRGVFSEI